LGALASHTTVPTVLVQLAQAACAEQSVIAPIADAERNFARRGEANPNDIKPPVRMPVAKAFQRALWQSDSLTVNYQVLQFMDFLGLSF
jgi:hypothetical protein